MNAQDVDVYVLTKNGAYVYDAANHTLALVASGDHRAELGVPPAPVHLFLVSDGSRLQSLAPPSESSSGAPSTAASSRRTSGCSAPPAGLATRPRASFDAEKLKAVLKLKDTQHAFLNHPVGYPPPAEK